MLRYLLDTNTASQVIKGNVPRIREQLLKVPTSDVAVSVITEAELLFGLRKRPEATRLANAVGEFLKYVDIRPWDSAAASQYAELRAVLEMAGTPMGNLDLMIAAQALSLGAILVSGDRVFRRVEGLTVQDWGRLS